MDDPRPWSRLLDDPRPWPRHLDDPRRRSASWPRRRRGRGLASRSATECPTRVARPVVRRYESRQRRLGIMPYADDFYARASSRDDAEYEATHHHHRGPDRLGGALGLFCSVRRAVHDSKRQVIASETSPALWDTALRLKEVCADRTAYRQSLRLHRARGPLLSFEFA